MIMQTSNQALILSLKLYLNHNQVVNIEMNLEAICMIFL